MVSTTRWKLSFSSEHSRFGGRGAVAPSDGHGPWRLQGLAFKALRRLRPDYPLWRDFPYEYERTRLAIEEGCGGFDMLKGDYAYKYRFGSHPRAVKRLVVTR